MNCLSPVCTGAEAGLSLAMLTTPPEPNDHRQDADASLGKVTAAVRKNWVLVAVLTVCVGLGVAFYTLGQTRIYEARATIMFDPQPPRPLGEGVATVVGMGGDAYWNNKEYYRTQYWVIQSMRVASQVVRQLALHKDPAFLANASSDKALPVREVAVEDAAQRLLQRLTVEPLKESRLAVVIYTDADPVRAQRVVGAVAETYVQNNLDDALESTTSAADWLRGQHNSLKTELEKSEMALHAYKKNKNILSVSMDDQSNMLRGEMSQLNSALTTVRTRREQVISRRDELKKISAEDPAELPAMELINSPVLQTLRDDFVSADRDYNALVSSGKGGNHPDVRAAGGRRNVTRKALLAEVRNIQRAVESELAGLTKEMRGLERLYGSAERRALELNLLEIEYKRLQRTKDTNEKLFSLVTERTKESDLARMLRVNNVRVADPPLLPKTPVSPNVPLNLGGGIVAGLVLGLIAAIAREQLDRSIKSPEDAERELGLLSLGLLPEVSGLNESSYAARARNGGSNGSGRGVNTNPELMMHRHPTSGIAEAARAIRTNLLFMSPDRPYRRLLVTSSGPAEGKTTVACCIAIAMAQAGRSVALVDCDMRRPRLHRIFEKSNQLGLTSVLIDPDAFDDAIKETEVPNLSVVTTGPLPPNPAELLHSEAFARTLARLSERFETVVIDSPPVVPVTDAAVLSTKVDGTVIVVRASKTSRDVARRAVRALRDVGGQLIGNVLNAVDLSRRGYGYQNYYYYSNAGYAQDPKDDPERPEAGAAA